MPTPTAATTPALTMTHVNWKGVVLPGSVCGSSQPIRLQAGQATVTSNRFPGTPHVHVALGQIVYGNLTNLKSDAIGDAAAVNITCDNGSGTADGQLSDSWVIFTGDTGTLATAGTLVPQQPANTNLPHVPYLVTTAGGIVMQPGKITVKELWFGPNDATCCPSIRATTVWSYSGGSVHPISTTHS